MSHTFFFFSARDSSFAERESAGCLWAPQQPAVACPTPCSTYPSSCQHPNHGGFLSPRGNMARGLGAQVTEHVSATAHVTRVSATWGSDSSQAVPVVTVGCAIRETHSVYKPP